MAAVTQADLENALSPQTVLALFDDNNDGTADPAPIAAVCARATARADSWLAGVYDGPFPLTGTLPAMYTELALEYAVAFSFERHPEYVRSFGEVPRAERWKRADEMGMRLQAAVLRMPDHSQKVPANVGTPAYDGASRIYVDSVDGTKNSGDF